MHTILRLLIQYRYLGAWTNIRNVGANSNLAAVGFKHGLDKCVILNDGTPKVSNGSMATTVEAIIGAVELDGGVDATLQVATRLGLVHQSIALVTSQNLFLSPCLNERYLQLT